MEYFRPFVENFMLFLIVSARVAGIFVVAPFYSSSAIPARFKGLIIFLITLALFPLINTLTLTVPQDLAGLVYILVPEFVFGFIIGFVMQLISTAFLLSGEFFSIQMGLSLAEVVDPISQVHIPLIGQLNLLLSTLVFISMKGPEILITTIFNSYKVIPVLNLTGKSNNILSFLAGSSSYMFVLALKLALPIMGTLLLVSLGLGIMAKIAPQMNILMLGFPLKIGIGFITLMLVIPALIKAADTAYNNGFDIINKLILSLRI